MGIAKSSAVPLAIPPLEEPRQLAEIVYNTLIDSMRRGEL